MRCGLAQVQSAAPSAHLLGSVDSSSLSLSRYSIHFKSRSWARRKWWTWTHQPYTERRRKAPKATVKVALFSTGFFFLFVPSGVSRLIVRHEITAPVLRVAAKWWRARFRGVDGVIVIYWLIMKFIGMDGWSHRSGTTTLRHGTQCGLCLEKPFYIYWMFGS